MRIECVDVHAFARFVHPFELPLARQGLVLVEGANLDSGDAFNSNAAGKSMLFEPIPWVFYDKMARYGDERLGAEEVCYGGNDADAEARFETSRGRFLARRRRRQRGASQLTVRAWNETEWVPLQGIAPDVMLATSDLTSLLGFDYRTLRSAIFLQSTGLTVSASTYAEQIRTLESVLRFDEFTRGAERARETSRALDAEVREQLNELDRASQTVESARLTMTELETLDETEREHELLTEIRRMRNGLTAAPGVRTALQIASAEFERRQGELAAAERAVVAENTRLAELDRITSDTCPTCGGRVDEDTLKLLREGYEEHRDSAVSSAGFRRTRLEEVREELNRLSTEANRLADLTRDLHNAERELRDLRERKSKRLQMIQTQQERHDVALARLESLTESVASGRQRLRIAENWARRDFEAIKAETLSAASPVLNDAATRFSDILTDGELRVEFSPMRESRSDKLLRFYRSDGTEVSYKSLSNGERRRVDLIVALSLRALARWRLAEPINVTVWDEVFDPLDDSGIGRALEILQQDMDELESVFVITHNATLRALFPGARTWRVVRERGVSHVEFN